ncbi:hypothetical protein CAPTEDRAFT_184815 [Capitella teleta]|uniref:L-serine ammonia-lyase n=1 Tax=Capitella teleta TaxID=283909 RepID=R7UFX0_CAPTE|nr:hypothetical protein CAPTEDRAFT_184815 [Capitella teleta]|eukprot:ELU05075.1 hypothetical protein CAPTEDRAFT_184815 [Capitella teleta]
MPGPDKVFKETLMAQKRLKPYIHNTPVFTSESINKLIGKQVYFKCDNLQRTGSFKLRGACNAVLKLKESSPNVQGVVTRSSGNHGMGVAYAAQKCGLQSKVVIRQGTAKVKGDALQVYGAEVIYCNPTPADSIAAVQRVQQETGYTMISSFENDDVLFGQGTVGLEFFDQVSDLDAVFIPLCGGSLTASVAAVAKYRSPNTKVYAVEPEGKGLEKCMREGNTSSWPSPPNYITTIAEAIQLQYVAKQNFPLLCELVEKEVFAVTDSELVEAMMLVFQRLKLVVEPSGAAGLAAVMSSRMKEVCGDDVQKVGIILSGGNVDLDNLPWGQRQ